MHFNKKKVLLVVGIIAALAIIAGSVVQIMLINKGLPNVSVVHTYTKDNPALEDGLLITPLKVHVYTVEEYNETFEELSAYSSLSEAELDNKKTWKIAVYTMRYENTTNETLQYYPFKYNGEAKNSHWFNGVQPIDRVHLQKIAPGEQQEIIVAAPIVEGSIITKKDFKRAEEDEYTLVYGYYPERKELVFTYE